jgi:hypothetical protein
MPAGAIGSVFYADSDRGQLVPDGIGRRPIPFIASPPSAFEQRINVGPGAAKPLGKVPELRLEIPNVGCRLSQPKYRDDLVIRGDLFAGVFPGVEPPIAFANHVEEDSQTTGDVEVVGQDG